jgi:hypothetical protein
MSSNFSDFLDLELLVNTDAADSADARDASEIPDSLFCMSADVEDFLPCSLGGSRDLM